MDTRRKILNTRPLLAYDSTSKTVMLHFPPKGQVFCYCGAYRNKLGSTMSDFLSGFFQGAKETPRAFFAPAIALWRLLVDSTESLLNQEEKNKS